MHAAARGHTDVVKVLLRAGADVTAVDSDGRAALMHGTALMHASARGHTEVLRLLKRAGPRVRAVESD